MRRDHNQHLIEELLALADVRIGGGRSWDLTVHDDDFFPRVAAGGSLALGETYVEGLWDCPALDAFFHRALRSRLDERVPSGIGPIQSLRSRLQNPQSRANAFEVGERHYDLGNDLYRAMLDTRMIYSCAVWDRASTLDDAQEDKLELACRKLGLERGMTLLDLGCGWGGGACYAAERFGVSVVGVTVSRRQAELAREVCAGLPVEIRLQDWREVEGRFDRVISIGMFEHVGARNYAAFFERCLDLLRPDGLALLHTIGGTRSETTCEPWMERYIFPNSVVPSARQLTRALEGSFVIEDWHSLGADYDRTLTSWYRNFENAWDELRPGYGERFRRMWKYYLLSSAGSFRARRSQVWQLVLSPLGVPGGYRRPGLDTRAANEELIMA